MARQPSLKICYAANFNVMKIPSAGKNTLWRENTLWRDPLWRDFTVMLTATPREALVSSFDLPCSMWYEYPPDVIKILWNQILRMSVQ